MAKLRTLSVVPNPFLAHDSDGRPCSVAYRSDTARPEPIGATITGETSDGELIYQFTSEPVSLPDKAEHRKLFHGRQILPADEATARLVGVPFVPVATALATARAEAAARYLAETGEASEFLTPSTPAPVAPSPIPVPASAVVKES